MKAIVSSVIVAVVLFVGESNAFSGPFVPSTTKMAPKSRSSMQMVDCKQFLVHFCCALTRQFWQSFSFELFIGFIYEDTHPLFFGCLASPSSANVIQGAGIAVAGLVAGIGLVAFTEAQGERAKERGGGISDSMSTQLSGKFLEDVEVSSVDDIGSLTSQLEEALKKSAGTETEELEMTEEEAQKLREEADDGW